MTPYLTRAELIDLTGRKYAPAQKKLLRARQIRFIEDAFGRPKVLRAAIEKKLLGEPVTPAPAPEQLPDFTGFPALRVVR